MKKLYDFVKAGKVGTLVKNLGAMSVTAGLFAAAAVAGIGIQAFSSENFGYEGKLSERVKIIPEVLQKSGYKSFISGKWHIGGDPYERGFHNSFSLLPGAFTHYDNNKPIEAYPDSSFSQNGKRILWPEGEYSTDFYTQ